MKEGPLKSPTANQMAAIENGMNPAQVKELLGGRHWREITYALKPSELTQQWNYRGYDQASGSDNKPMIFIVVYDKDSQKVIRTEVMRDMTSLENQ